MLCYSAVLSCCRLPISVVSLCNSASYYFFSVSLSFVTIANWLLLSATSDWDSLSFYLRSSASATDSWTEWRSFWQHWLISTIYWLRLLLAVSSSDSLEPIILIVSCLSEHSIFNSCLMSSSSLSCCLLCSIYVCLWGYGFSFASGSLVLCLFFSLLRRTSTSFALRAASFLRSLILNITWSDMVDLSVHLHQTFLKWRILQSDGFQLFMNVIQYLPALLGTLGILRIAFLFWRLIHFNWGLWLYFRCRDLHWLVQLHSW